MAAPYSPAELDQLFYQSADAFFLKHHAVALTYDDVTLATMFSEVLPRDTQLQTTLAEGLDLQIPVLSADMDTVTESRMAIAMALNGGLGLIHYNLTEKEQLSEVSRVKNHVHGLIQEPIKVHPEQEIGEIVDLVERKRFAFSTFPVVDGAGKLLGLLPGHVVKPRYARRKVGEALTPRSQVFTLDVRELGADPIARADRFFTDHPGIHKLLVVDDQDQLRGLFTLSDIERITMERAAQLKPARDHQFRLLCGAALSTYRKADGSPDRERMLTMSGPSSIAVWTRWRSRRRTATAGGSVKPCAPFARPFRDFRSLPET